MQSGTPPKASGAGFGVIVFALVVTAGIGAVVKQRERRSNDRTFEVATEDVTVDVMEHGTGTPNVGGSPPANGWVKFRLREGGKPIQHRPIKFERVARDRRGRSVRTDQVWSDGVCYLVARSGFHEREAPVSVTLSDHGRTVASVEIPELSPSVKAVLPSDPVPKGLTLTFHQLKGRGVGNDDLGVEVVSSLGKDEVWAVGRTGSTYQPLSQRRPLSLAQVGGISNPTIVPLDLDYLDDVQTVSIELIRFRAVPTRKTITLPVRYLSESPSARFYSPLPTIAEISPTLHMGFSRTNRFVAAARSSDSFLMMLLGTSASVAWCRTTLTQPLRLHEARVLLLNQINSPGGTQRTPAFVRSSVVSTPNPGDLIDFKIDVDAGVYQQAERRIVTVPFRPTLVKDRKAKPIVTAFSPVG